MKIFIYLVTLFQLLISYSIVASQAYKPNNILSPQSPLAKQRTFGDRLRHLRTLKGWSQNKLSNEAGLGGVGVVSNLEHSKRKPTPSSAFKLARALEVPVNFLLGTAIIPVPNQNLFDLAI